MGLKTEEKEIDGLRISVTQYAVIRQTQLMVRVGQVLMPVVSVLGDVIFAGKKPSITEMMKMDIGPVLSALFAHVDPKDVPGLICEILGGTSVIEGNVKTDLIGEAKINGVFSGRGITIFKAMGFALQVNFADFGAAVGELNAHGENLEEST